jgi:hypothetical protein
MKKNLKKSVLLISIPLLLGGFMAFFTHNLYRNQVTMNPEGVIFTKNETALVFGYEPNWTPSSDDIGVAEKILTECIRGKSTLVFNKLSDYKRQYFGVSDEHGTDLIAIVAFIDLNKQFDYWKHKRVLVLDGADNFFDALVDINNRSCVWLSVHK